jgi:hypothetical protein
MLETHKRIFSEVAQQLQYFILVRDTNKDSLDYIGKKDYAPKRIDCKAKTAHADVNGKKLAGLVTSPIIHPSAFKVDKLQDALDKWKSMNIMEAANDNYGFFYSVDTTPESKHYGCLMFNGKYIHGDYDLYDIVDVNHLPNNLALVSKLYGVRHMIGLHFDEVKKLVNSKIGVEMIQHSGEAQYATHSEQAIDAFCPNGEYKRIDELHQLHGLYKDTFKGRITLADSFPIPPQNYSKNPLAKNVIRIDSHPDFFKNKFRK